MLQTTFSSLLSAFIGLISCAVVIPSILKISAERSLYDQVDERKIHRGRISRLGGLAFMPAIVFAVAFTIAVDNLVYGGGIFPASASSATLICLGLCSVVAIYLVGMADDMIGVRYSAKFVVQIFAATCLTISGTTIGSLNGCLGIWELHPLAAFLLTALVVVFVVNAVNLIDGLDGLAGGICLLISLYDGIIFYNSGNPVFAVISFAVAGTLLAYLYFNLFGNPEKNSKIFMGDTGSLTLGIVVSFLCVVMANEHLRIGTLTPDPLAMAFAPLLIPCLDVLRVFFGRMRHGKSPFLPDKTHIHHLLLARGLSQRATLVTILLAMVLLTVGSVWLSVYVNVGWVLLADIILYVLFAAVIVKGTPKTA